MNILALVLEGGQRIVDCVSRNLANLDITSIYVLAQHKPQSLITHVRTTWAAALAGPGRFVSVALPGIDSACGPSQGGAMDDVYKNLHLCTRHAPDLVVVFATDHVCRMDVGQMVEAHVQAEADISSAAVPVPV